MLDTDCCPGTSAEQLVEWTGVHLTTARRWKRGHALPEGIRRYLALLHEKDLGTLDARWRGWRITDAGTLASPEDWQYTPGEVRELTLLRAELARQKAAEDRAREPPPPPSGSSLDWIDGDWKLPAEPESVAPYQPLWPSVLAAARASDDAYVAPRRVFYRRVQR